MVFNLFFYWRIIALQNFVVFCQTSTWISYRYTYIPSHLTPLVWYRAPVWVSWDIEEIISVFNGIIDIVNLNLPVHQLRLKKWLIGYSNSVISCVLENTVWKISSVEERRYRCHRRDKVKILQFSIWIGCTFINYYFIPYVISSSSHWKDLETMAKVEARSIPNISVFSI